MTVDLHGKSNRKLLMRGVAWNSIYQAFQIVVSFGAMLALVRVIPPSEYGRAATVVGFLVMLNSLNCGLFFRQALQLPAAVEPDWSLHLSAGLYIQGTLVLVCQAFATGCWFLPSYRPIAPLMHLAGIGLVFDLPSGLAVTMLRRDMNFRRLRIVHGIGTLLATSVSLAVGLSGGGAYAIVLASNVLGTIPFGFDLLVIRGWRPRAGWWRFPGVPSYRAALRFGFQQVGSTAAWGGRSMLEAAVLPGAVGFAAIGLWNRAQALYSTSLGRLYPVLIETVYPLLPMYAADRKAYPRKATLFAQVMVWLILPGTLFLGMEGREMSRMIYGSKWIAADPMIWPGAMAGLALSLFTVFSTIVLAANRLRASLTMDCICGALGLPAIASIWFHCSLPVYAWMVAIGMFLGSCVAIYTARQHIAAGGLRAVFAPPAFASLAGVMVLELLRRTGWPSVLAGRVFLCWLAFAVTVLLVFRIAFGRALCDMLAVMPAGNRIMQVVRLIPAPISNADPVAVSPARISNG